MKHHNEPEVRYKKNSNGFTLVELLVVVAIISLMATFSLVAIARYRDRARDSRTETALTQVRNVATIIYNDNNSYTNMVNNNSLCLADTLNENNPALNFGLKSIKKETKNFSGQDPLCYASTITYCVQSRLISGRYYCVDSTGVAVETANPNCTADNIKCSAP